MKGVRDHFVSFLRMLLHVNIKFVNVITYCACEITVARGYWSDRNECYVLGRHKNGNYRTHLLLLIELANRCPSTRGTY